MAYPKLDAVTVKFSYHRSPFYDPADGIGNAIKDYDGSSFWLVIRPEDLLARRPAAYWPDWLAVSIGHSADGLSEALPTPEHPHRRVIMVGLDLDLLRAVHWPKPWMRTLATGLSYFRIPAPALRIAPDWKWHWLYY